MTSAVPAAIPVGSGPQLPAADGSTDPHRWLEDVTGEEALAWVRERNERAAAELDAVPDPADPEGGSLSRTLQEEILAILDAEDRIPDVTLRGDHLYNLWADAEHERGLWRRTTMEQYRSGDPEWEILLDVDALNREEDEDWVWHGAQLLRPAEGEPYRHALIDLSHGGSDADVTREFDLETLSFVPPPEEGGQGFSRPAAKGGLSWIDRDTVWVTTDLGEGSLTTSGYARQARIWRRGTPLAEAEQVFEAAESDMAVFAVHDSTPGWERDWIIQAHAFYDSTHHLVDRSQDPPVVARIDFPGDMEVSAHRDLGIFSPRSDWEVAGTVYPAGSLVVGDLAAFLAGRPELTMLFEPTPRTSLAGLSITRDTLVLTVLEDVVDRLEVHHRDEHGAWVRQDLFPDLTGALGVRAVDSEVDDRIWLSVTDFLEPTSLRIADLAEVPLGGSPEEPETLRTTPARFEAAGLEATQHFAHSADGTRVPYFQIGPVDPGPGPAPTLLYGYGGFEISLTPAYLGATGKAWSARGGTYVIANIRGGGEYGPAWHQAALTENRHRAYEDFAAVAQDLIERGVTDASHLAVRGGSNGGLLTGNMLTRYPELLGAVVIQVPLLDMKRYSHLLAGASWMAEYGDPDTADWEFIRLFSPYHQLDADTVYPPAFLLTSTRDDRVHPGHARKMTAALESIGADVRAYENIEGGHGGAATHEQAARMNALMYTFLWDQLGPAAAHGTGQA